MTDIIEKAVTRLNKREDESLVERATGKLATDRVEDMPVRDHIPTGSIRADFAVPPKTGSPRPAARNASKYAKLDIARLRAEGILTPTNENSRIAEEFRMIKRPLLRKAFGQDGEALTNGNLIMVVSAAPNEGKTFTAICLAMSIASEQDKHVMLVDADLNAPSVLDRLGVEADMGLTDYLEKDDIDLADVLVHTNVSNLTLLPAGHAHILGPELLASKRMEQLVSELANRYPDRVIIIDTGPILGSTEAIALAPQVGQTVFVVEAEKSSRPSIQTSLEMLAPCQSVSLVLNKAQTRSKGNHFGSYYGSSRRRS